MALYGAAGHSHEASDFSVCQIQNTVQNQNALFLLWQAGECLGYKLVVNEQIISMRRKNVAVAGVIIYRGELVQFLLCQGVQRLFTVALLSHLAQIIFGLIAEYRLAKCVIAVPQDKVIAGDRIHLLTPFLWVISVVLSLSAKVTFEKPPATR